MSEDFRFRVAWATHVAVVKISEGFFLSINDLYQLHDLQPIAHPGLAERLHTRQTLFVAQGRLGRLTQASHGCAVHGLLVFLIFHRVQMQRKIRS